MQARQNRPRRAFYQTVYGQFTADSLRECLDPSDRAERERGTGNSRPGEGSDPPRAAAIIANCSVR